MPIERLTVGDRLSENGDELSDFLRARPFRVMGIVEDWVVMRRPHSAPLLKPLSVVLAKFERVETTDKDGA